VDRTIFESTTISVGKDLRVKLPQSFLPRVEWITGKQPLDAWLLVANAGRCRLISAAEVENDRNLQNLHARILAEIGAPTASAIEFHDEVSLALGLRLLPVEISPPDPGWRLMLPRILAAIMLIRPGESELGALLVQGHIEFWTVEELRSAVSPSLTQIL
jgi:hypothetical protein